MTTDDRKRHLTTLADYAEQLGLADVAEMLRGERHLFKLTRKDSIGYDEFDSCVVVAHDEDSALNVTPGDYGWAHVSNLMVERVGATTLECGVVVCASFNAG